MPNSETCAKLMMVSFRTAKKNLSVYKMVQECSKYNDYLQNERMKLLSKYGTDNRDGTFKLEGDNVGLFNAKVEEILDTECETNFCIPELAEEDFEEDNCQYPNDKRFWINGRDIMAVLSFINKLKSERNSSNGI